MSKTYLTDFNISHKINMMREISQINIGDLEFFNLPRMLN